MITQTPPSTEKLLSYIVQDVLTSNEVRALKECCAAGHVDARRAAAIRALADKHRAAIPVVMAATGFLPDEDGRYVDTTDTDDFTRTAVLGKDRRVRCAYALWRWLHNEGCELIVE
jgi:hypothetical protein